MMKSIKAMIMIMTITLSLCVYVSGTATARDEVVADHLTFKTGSPPAAVDREGAVLTFPAAAQRAENRAEASAGQARAEILKARQMVAEAEAALNEARHSGNQKAIEEARARYDSAQRSLDGAISHSTGISMDEISALRSAGMEWGQIAAESGIHPRALGLESTEFVKANEMEMATARDPQNGHSLWHGTRLNGKGLGLDRTESKKGIARETEDNAGGADLITGIDPVADAVIGG